MLKITNNSRHSTRGGRGRPRAALKTAFAAASLLILGPVLATAQEAQESEAPTVAAPTVTVELNKLEPKGSDCRAFFVINNKSDQAFDKLQMEFFVFRPDGIIDQSFAVDLAPLKAKKQTVKRFDITDTSCDNLGSILINDVTKCQAGTEELSDCLEKVAVSSRTDTDFKK